MLNDVSECSEVVIQPKECQEIKCFSFIFLNQDNRLGKYVLSPMGGDQRMGIISFFKTFHGRRMHYILLTNILSFRAFLSYSPSSNRHHLPLFIVPF